MAINLLPQELRPKGYFLGLSKAINKITLISVVFLLVTGSLALASYMYIKYQLSNSEKKQNELESNIKALQATEQKMILIRGRLQKINEIETSENIKKSIAILEDLLEITKNQVVLNEVELKPTSAVVLIGAANSLELTRFLADLIGKLDLVRVEMLSLDYNPIKGYEMKLSLAR